MSELTREEILKAREQSRGLPWDGARRDVAICDMALRCLDAESELDRLRDGVRGLLEESMGKWMLQPEIEKRLHDLLNEGDD